MLINMPSPDLCLSSHTQSSCNFPPSPLLPLTSVAAASRTVCSPSSRGSAQCSGLRVLAQPQPALPALSVWSGHKALCQVGQRPIQTSREPIQEIRGCFPWSHSKTPQGGLRTPDTIPPTVSCFSLPLLSYFSTSPPSFLPLSPPLSFSHPEKNLIPLQLGVVVFQFPHGG